MKPPAPRNREYDAIRLLRSQLQIALVLLRVARNGLDDALHLDLPRNALLARVAHDTVAERLAHVEEQIVALFRGVLDVLLVPHQLRDGIDHVRTIVEHRQAVSIEQRVAQAPAVDATVVCTLRTGQIVLNEDVAQLEGFGYSCVSNGSTRGKFMRCRSS